MTIIFIHSSSLGNFIHCVMWKYSIALSVFGTWDYNELVNVSKKSRIPGYMKYSGLSSSMLLVRISANVGHHLLIFLGIRPPSAAHPNK